MAGLFRGDGRRGGGDQGALFGPALNGLPGADNRRYVGGRSRDGRCGRGKGAGIRVRPRRSPPIARPSTRERGRSTTHSTEAKSRAPEKADPWRSATSQVPRASSTQTAKAGQRSPGPNQRSLGRRWRMLNARARWPCATSAGAGRPRRLRWKMEAASRGGDLRSPSGGRRTWKSEARASDLPRSGLVQNHFEPTPGRW